MGTTSLIKLSDGYHVKTQPLIEEEFIELSSKAKDYLIEWEKEIYILDNNSIVYKGEYNNKIYYGWFSSLNDMRRLNEDEINRKFSRHFFEGYNPYQKHFPDKTKELIENLFFDLGLNCENIIIDYSTIRKVDKAIQYQDDAQIFMITHILHISSLVGEVFISENEDAEWYMDRDADGETWTPMIKINRISDKTSTIGFVHWLYEDIMHYSGHSEVLLSSYLSLNDFSEMNLLTPEKGSNSKLKVIDGKIIKD